MAGCVVYLAYTFTRSLVIYFPSYGGIDDDHNIPVHGPDLAVALVEDMKYDKNELDVPARLVEAGVAKNLDTRFRAAMTSVTTTNSPVSQQLAPYAIADLVEPMSMFEDTYGILLYDPESDGFLLLYNIQIHKWKSSCAKLVTSFRLFTNILRQSFPERFRGPESPELGKSLLFQD